MRTLLAHLAILSITFISMLIILLLALAVIVGTFSFVFWTLPPIPTLETVYFVVRILTAVSTIITLTYSLSADYKQSVREYLSS